MKRTSYLMAMVSSVFLVVPDLTRADPFCNSFRRGDSNVDGAVDMSDGIATLEFLFLGNGVLPCRDAANADGSRALDISDPIVTFQYLFLGGAPLLFPGPLECGRGDLGGELSLGCDSYDACAPRPERIDFSGFQRFRYSQQGALGFCVELNKVFAATVTRDAAGGGESRYVLNLSILKEGKRGVDPCLDNQGIFTAECPVEVQLPERRLEDEEVQAMKNLFVAVTVFPGPDAICQCVAIDPCVIQFFTWDDRQVAAFPCISPHLDNNQAAPILDLLENWRGNQ